MKRLFVFLILSAALVALFSCARAPVVRPPAEYPYGALPPSAMPRADVFHVVAPGETLWRLSKMYDVKIGDIMSANSLVNGQSLEMGQKLLIPDATPGRCIISSYLYDTDKWKYIIIHHSATDEDSSLSLYWLHRQRGFDEGLGYHFVIDNGTYGKGDGEIEMSPRWIKQRDGAHCKANGMNRVGIGICLVGNFSRDRISAKQMDSLVYLVNVLRKRYKIPEQNIIGHGQVPGARTECPGKNFPWAEFYASLDSEKDISLSSLQR